MNVFFSYSHEDEELRKQLEKHLSVLRNEGVIDIWHDRRIMPGEEIDKDISQHLESADIILLLVSPDFLHSNYCYQIEMKRAIERHEQREAIVIPIILRPCDWKNTPFVKLKALPNDGKPVIKHQSVDEAFLSVVSGIRNVIQNLNQYANDTNSVMLTAQPTRELKTKIENRSSNLRIRQEITDYQKNKFLIEAFEFIAQYFKNSLSELTARNSDVEIDFRMVNSNKFEAVIYVRGQEGSWCSVWLGDKNFGSEGIYFSQSRSFGSNSFNDVLYVEIGDANISFRPLGSVNLGYDSQKALTTEAAAEYYWRSFIERVQ